MKAFVKLTDPVIRLFHFVTPGFLIKPMVPLYVAWFFYMFRFYLMPYLMGYSVMGMLSFPLESEITGFWLPYLVSKTKNPQPKYIFFCFLSY